MTIFQKKPSSRVRVLHALGTSNSDEDNNMLTTLFVFEEFKEDIYFMQADKSYGPNGFNLGFYQLFWDICGTNIFNCSYS